MIKAVIFDCFGVLIEDALKALCQELLADQPEKLQEVVDLMHASHHGLITPEDSNRQVAALLRLDEADYRRRVVDGEVKNQELLDYILTLKQKYKAAILSNISTGGIDRRFTEAELKRHFDVVVTSAETGYAKPEAQIYEVTADKLGVRLNECVFIDDNPDFCDAARGLGMRAIAYNDFTQFKRELTKLLA